MTHLPLRMLVPPPSLFLMGACLGMAALTLSTTHQARRNPFVKSAVVSFKVLAALLVGIAAGLRATTYSDVIPAGVRFAAIGSLAAIAIWLALAWAKKTFVDQKTD